MARLIDADRLLREAQERYNNAAAEFNVTAGPIKKIWVSDIKKAPTVDPVKHAHWYYDPNSPVGCGVTIGGMFCSNCDGDYPTGSHPYREYRDFKYCPYCGAKMDEVTE